MASIGEQLDKYPYSRSLLLVLLAVVLIYLRSCQLEHREERGILAFQSAIDERIERVTASIDKLGVADPALLACVRRAAMDRANIHPSSTGGIDDVRELELLYCPGADIHSLDGIGELARLSFLDVSRNRVRSLAALRQHPQLSTLNVSDNPIEDLRALQSLPALRQLYLPDMPELPCEQLERLVTGVKSNIKSITCKKPQGAGLASSSSGTRREDRPHELTDAQQDELLRFELQSRYEN